MKKKKLNDIRFFDKNLYPLLRETANTRINLAMAISDSTEKFKYTKKQISNIEHTILDLCGRAFASIEPNKEQEELYDKWSELSYQEEVQEQEEQMKDVLSSFVNQMFGADIDFSNFDPNDPKSFIDINEKLKETMEIKQQEEFEKKSKKKKTKKQIEKEQKLEAEEELKNKNVRSIYISLAKILHPDSETDPKIKEEKEEIMKKVTKAYENKDFSTLLKLEIEWIHKENKHLEKLTDEKLKIYISVLKEQVQELHSKKHSISLNPRYEPINRFAHLKDKTAITNLKKEIKINKDIIEDFNNFINEFKLSRDKKNIVDFVNDYIKVIQMEEMVFSMPFLFD
ncbi:MAG: hypothetical protein U0354_19525 [Candidatus Sericytochromatia bacterium]